MSTMGIISQWSEDTSSALGAVAVVIDAKGGCWVVLKCISIYTAYIQWHIFQWTTYRCYVLVTGHVQSLQEWLTKSYMDSSRSIICYKSQMCCCYEQFVCLHYLQSWWSEHSEWWTIMETKAVKHWLPIFSCLRTDEKIMWPWQQSSDRESAVQRDSSALFILVSNWRKQGFNVFLF